MHVSIIDYILDKDKAHAAFSFIGSLDTGNFIEFEKKFLKDIDGLVSSDEVSEIIFNCGDLDFINDAGVGLFFNTTRRLMASDIKVKFADMNAIVEHRLAELIDSI